MSHAACVSMQKAAEGPRGLEIHAISHVTGKLVAANDPGVEPLDRTHALNGNVRLWSLLTQDLSNTANALLTPIKASCLSIGIYVRKANLSATDNKTDLSTLNRINKDILDALKLQRRAA
jgi:flagellar biosynthesis regulator FlaF